MDLIHMLVNLPLVDLDLLHPIVALGALLTVIISSNGLGLRLKLSLGLALFSALILHIVGSKE